MGASIHFVASKFKKKSDKYVVMEKTATFEFDLDDEKSCEDMRYYNINEQFETPPYFDDVMLCKSYTVELLKVYNNLSMNFYEAVINDSHESEFKSWLNGVIDKISDKSDIYISFYLGECVVYGCHKIVDKCAWEVDEYLENYGSKDYDFDDRMLFNRLIAFSSEYSISLNNLFIYFEDFEAPNDEDVFNVDTTQYVEPLQNFINSAKTKDELEYVDYCMCAIDICRLNGKIVYSV